MMMPNQTSNNQTNWKVIKLGGSLLSPHETGLQLLQEGKLPIDLTYVQELLTEVLQSGARCVLVVGGGFLNRWYLQQVNVMNLQNNDYTNDLHMIGMAASDINASVLRMLATERLGAEFVYPSVVKYADYGNLSTLKAEFEKYRMVIAAGWKPGHSHDVDALLFGSLFNEKQVYSFKNIDGIYTADPKTNPTAVKKKTLSWQEYRDIIKTSIHVPGASFPVDAVAAQLAEKSGLGMTVIDGRDMRAVREVLLEGITTRGSTIVV